MLVNRRKFLSKILKGLPVAVTIETGLPLIYDFFESLLTSPLSIKNSILISKTYSLKDVANRIYFRKEKNSYFESTNPFRVLSGKAYAMRIQSVNRLETPARYYEFAGYTHWGNNYKPIEEWAGYLKAFTKTNESPLSFLALSTSNDLPISLELKENSLVGTAGRPFRYGLNQLRANSVVDISAGGSTNLLVCLDSSFENLKYSSPWQFSDYTENFNTSAINFITKSPHLIFVNKNIKELVDMKDHEPAGFGVAIEIALDDTQILGIKQALSDTLISRRKRDALRLVEPIKKSERIFLEKRDSVGDKIEMNYYLTNEGSLNISRDTYAFRTKSGETERGVRIAAVNKRGDPDWPRLKFYKEIM